MSRHGPLCRDMGRRPLEAAKSRQRFHVVTGLAARSRPRFQVATGWTACKASFGSRHGFCVATEGTSV